MARKTQLWRIVPPASVVVLIAAGVVAGLFQVRGGEVGLVRRAAGVAPRVVGPGWHWRLPWASELLRLPTAPLRVKREVTVRTAKSAALVLAVEGRLTIAAGQKRDWVEAAN